MAEEYVWGADCPVSLPHPKEYRGPDPVEADVGGHFVMTPMGLRFNLTEADREALYLAPYTPVEGR